MFGHPVRSSCKSWNTQDPDILCWVVQTENKKMTSEEVRINSFTQWQTTSTAQTQTTNLYVQLLTNGMTYAFLSCVCVWGGGFYSQNYINGQLTKFDYTSFMFEI